MGHPAAFLLALGSIALAGCGAVSVQPASVEEVGARTPDDLLIYGGPDHDVFLGCLTCSKIAPESVFNPSGPHGGKFAPASIHYRNGEYGSRHTVFSACNPYASDPPVIVDGNGREYGRLTVNRFHPEVTRNQDMLRWLEEEVCKE